MSPEVKSEFVRMVAARQRLMDLRSSRIEQLVRVRMVLKGLLADFLETLDPIANVRLAEVSADGSKANGTLAVSLAFFEGTRMRIAVDTSARFSHSVSVPSAFDDVARVIEIGISSDMARCEVLYEPIGQPGARKRLDLIAVAMALLAHAVAAVEAEAIEAPSDVKASTTLAPVAARPAVVPASAAVAPPTPVAPSTPVAPRFSVAGRIATTLAPAEPLRLTLAPIDAPNADVLTFNVG